MATPNKKTTVKKSETAAKTPAVKKATVKKPAVHKEPKVHEEVDKVEVLVDAPVEKAESPVQAVVKATAILDLKGRYAYAVGRRKTAVANVRLFNGASNQSEVNKKKLADYFSKNVSYIDTASEPLRLAGLEKDLYYVVKVAGGGLNAQAAAIAHGISQAIAKTDADFRKVLKKNGLMTRDSRMKERKKPGLKRARRGPQWAKR